MDDLLAQGTLSQIKAGQDPKNLLPKGKLDEAAATEKAKEFEALVLSQFVEAMTAGLDSNGPFGGGMGEGMFKSLLHNEYAKSLAGQGGLGLADNIKAELLTYQEIR